LLMRWTFGALLSMAEVLATVVIPAVSYAVGGCDHTRCTNRLPTLSMKLMMRIFCGIGTNEQPVFVDVFVK
jgi:hypothetical protein